MNRVRIASLVLALGAATASVAKTNDRAASRLDQFDRTGEKTSCLSIPSITRVDPINDTTFLFEVGVNRWYLNETSGTCADAGSSFTRIQYETSQASLCRLQIIKIIDNNGGFLHGTCSLGDFERLTPKPKAATHQ